MNTCRICQGQVRVEYRNLFDDRYGAIGKHNIIICQHCGFGQTIPGIEMSKISQFYAKHYPLTTYSAKDIKESVQKPNSFISWIRGDDNTCHWYIRKSTRVLDVGSGTGVSLLEIKALGGVAFGIEPDPNAQETAKKLNLNVFCGFIDDNPYPDIKFDYITASQVIEHDSNPINFLKNAQKKLKPGGKIILSFPNVNSLYRKIFGKAWINWHVPYHLSFLTRKSLEIGISNLGLKIKLIRTITPNAWTVMQFISLFNKPIEGEKGIGWRKIEKYRLNKKITPNRLFEKIIILLFLIPITFINRIVDSFGMGDSLFVILEYERN